MSWDILLINTHEKPDLDCEDTELPPFPSPKEIIKIFEQNFPGVSFDETGWGVILGNGFSIDIQLYLDEDEAQSQIMLNVRGKNDPAPRIAEMCKKNGWQAYDLTMGDYIDLDNPTRNGFSGWQSYVHQLTTQRTKQWWKFW